MTRTQARRRRKRRQKLRQITRRSIMLYLQTGFMKWLGHFGFGIVQQVSPAFNAKAGGGKAGWRTPENTQ